MEQIPIPQNTKQLLKVLQRFANEHQETDMQKVLNQVSKLVVQEKIHLKKTPKNQGNKQYKGRWARFSEEIKKNPPLHGLGDYVRKCSKEVREDFALTHEEA